MIIKKYNMIKTPAIGIDFGTSNCRLGVWKNGKVEIIINDIGERITPSYISFSNGHIFYGNEAKNKITSNPTNIFYSIKRLIGKKYDDLSIKSYMEYLPFKIIKDPKSEMIKIQLICSGEQKYFYVEEILAMILQNLRQYASNYLGKEVRDVLITIPDNFNYLQREKIRDSVRISGLNLLKIINETDSACLGYYYNKQMLEEKKILIFNFGGGFLNTSVVSIEDGLFETLALNGIDLGGEDFDNRLVEYCISEFKNETGIDIKKNTKALLRLKRYCEKAKIALSNSSKTNIEIDKLIDNKDLNILITREKFEELCMDLFKKCIPILNNILRDSKEKKSSINEICLVGGSTFIPKIRQIIQEFFNRKDIIYHMNLSEASAIGTAIRAAIFTNVHHEKLDKIVLLDVTQFSLGIGNVGGKMIEIIPRNSVLPVNKKISFYNSKDNQTSVLIQIFEGEEIFTKDNLFLGKIFFDNLLPMPREKNEIEINFDVDVNYIIIVRAKEIKSKKEQHLVINLSKNEIDVNKSIQNIENIKKASLELDNIEKEMNNLDNPKYIKQNQNLIKGKFEINKFNFNILHENNKIIVIFNSDDENINYAILCKDTDKFYKIENIFYEKYPDYKNIKFSLVVKGKKILRDKTLKENNIQNNDIINLLFD